MKRAMRTYLKKFVLLALLPAIYTIGTLRPLDERKVIFLEDKDATLSHNFQALWDHIQDTYNMQPMFITLQNTHVGMYRYVLNAIGFAWVAANARAIFLNDASSMVSALPIRRECDVVQVWHACGAFKKWGASTLGKAWMQANAKELHQMPHYAHTSLVSVSSSNVSWAYIEAMGLSHAPETVQALGVSRTDIFFDAEFLAHAKKHVCERLGIDTKKKLVLYAPTFRGLVAKARHPEALDIPMLKRCVGNEYTLLVKPHPFIKDTVLDTHESKDFAYDVRTIDIDILLAAADVLITDYSSVIFEYSLLERPMIFFDFDKQDYIDERDFYYTYEDFIPGPECSTTQEVCEALRACAEGFNPQAIREFKNTYMSACDGYSTEHICAYIFSDTQTQGNE